MWCVVTVRVTIVAGILGYNLAHVAIGRNWVKGTWDRSGSFLITAYEPISIPPQKFNLNKVRGSRAT